MIQDGRSCPAPPRKEEPLPRSGRTKKPEFRRWNQPQLELRVCKMLVAQEILLMQRQAINGSVISVKVLPALFP